MLKKVYLVTPKSYRFVSEDPLVAALVELVGVRDNDSEYWVSKDTLLKLTKDIEYGKLPKKQFQTLLNNGGVFLVLDKTNSDPYTITPLRVDYSPIKRAVQVLIDAMRFNKELFYVDDGTL
jgi:hypothetical protein